MGTERYNIFDPIVKWCNRNFFTDMLVTIKADEEIITTILYCEGLIIDESIRYEFLHDWDEGQENISLVGFFPLCNVELYCNPETDHIISIYDDKVVPKTDGEYEVN